jgi:hypothetical protein
MTHDDCFGDNATFARETGRGRVLLVRREEDSAALRACLADLDAALAKARIHKDSRSTKAGTLLLDDGREVFVKRYNNKGLRYTLRYLFRRARPFRAWAAAWACEQNGIPSPRPLAALAYRRAGVLREAWLIRAAVPTPVPTLTYVEQVLRQPRLREDFIAQVCALLATMHAAGIGHGDPKLSNIYARNEADKLRYGVWDLDGATLTDHPTAPATRNIDLARVISSLVDVAARLNRPLPPEPLADSFLATYAKLSGVSLNRQSVMKSAWLHLRK